MLIVAAILMNMQPRDLANETDKVKVVQKVLYLPHLEMFYHEDVYLRKPRKLRLHLPQVPAGTKYQLFTERPYTIASERTLNAKLPHGTPVLRFTKLAIEKASAFVEGDMKSDGMVFWCKLIKDNGRWLVTRYEVNLR
jgi:hypothetical protein